MSDVQGSAVFSDDGLHRQRLDRWWSEQPRLLACMANPSKAGADRNDPTVYSLMRLARALPGCGGITVVNAEDRIATDPADLRRWLSVMERDDPQGLSALRLANRLLIRELAQAPYIRVVAWGDLVPASLHATYILKSLSLHDTEDLYCFGTTKSGNPKAPAGTRKVPHSKHHAARRLARSAIGRRVRG